MRSRRLGRAYDVPEDVDEAELDAELEALGQEAEFDAASGVGVGEMPSFMQDEVAPPQFVDEPPETGKVKEAAG
jgi:charged multivesicular body protein 5